MEWKNIYRGLMMGTSDVIPGVSGGTIAVILGIYDQLIEAINGLFSKNWKAHLSFLIPLAIGMGVAIKTLAKVMTWLLDHHELLTYYFFIGLIIGIIPYLFTASDLKRTFKWYHLLFIISGIVAMFFLPESPEASGVITQFTTTTYIYLFFSGMLASAAMILPGVSGSFMLLVVGSYYTVLSALNDFNIPVILVVGTGIAIGFVVMSKLIHLALKYFRVATFSIIIGLVIGSIYVIFPGWTVGFGMTLSAIIIFFIGLSVAVILGKIEY